MNDEMLLIFINLTLGGLNLLAFDKLNRPVNLFAGVFCTAVGIYQLFTIGI